MPRLVVVMFFVLALVACSRARLDHGSLVIAMPVASGWVVCGDKRKMSNLVDPTEDEVKVFQLGPGVVAGATGLRRVIEGDTLFDVVEQVKAFARTRPFDGRDDYAEALAKQLGADFMRLVPTRIWPDVQQQEREAHSAFTVAIFWVTNAGLPRWADVNFHLVAGPRYATRSTNDTLATSNKLRPVILGNLVLIDELQHGSQPAFGEARRYVRGGAARRQSAVGPTSDGFFCNSPNLPLVSWMMWRPNVSASVAVRSRQRYGAMRKRRTSEARRASPNASCEPCCNSSISVRLPRITGRSLLVVASVSLLERDV